MTRIKTIQESTVTIRTASETYLPLASTLGALKPVLFVHLIGRHKRAESRVLFPRR